MEARDRLPVTAGQVARMRLEEYLTDALRDENDLTEWAFYTRLFIEARKITIDRSGYASAAYQLDREAALSNRRAIDG
jgi:hypothetical protein